MLSPPQSFRSRFRLSLGSPSSFLDWLRAGRPEIIWETQKRQAKRLITTRRRPHGEAATRLQPAENVSRFRDGLGFERVVVPPSVSSADDDPGIGERLEVPRQPRLRQVQLVHQFADTTLAREPEAH